MVQGAAEVVPVSSSAQLALLPGLLGWEQPPHRTTWSAALHAGSCAGIAWALRDDLRRLSRRDLARIAASSVPAAIAGALLADGVESRLGTRTQLISLMSGAGLALWAADRRAQHCELDTRAVAAAAAAQVLALAPGVSRSGATLTALRMMCVDRDESYRFSLLMSLPITAGAAALSLGRSDRAGLRGLHRPLAFGVPAAAVTAAAAATAASRRGGAPVGATTLYRLALAAAVAVRMRREPR